MNLKDSSLEELTVKIGTELLSRVNNRITYSFEDINEIINLCFELVESAEELNSNELDVLSISLSMLGTLSREPAYDHIMLLCEPFSLFMIVMKHVSHVKIQQKVLKIVCDYAHSNQVVSLIYNMKFHIHAMNLFKSHPKNIKIALYTSRILLGMKLEMNSPTTKILKTNTSENFFYQLCYRCIAHVFTLFNHRDIKSNSSLYLFIECMIADKLIQKQSEKIKADLIHYGLQVLLEIENTKERNNMLYAIRNFIKIVIKNDENKVCKTNEDIMDRVMLPKSQNGRIVYKQGGFDIIVKLINDCDDFDTVSIGTQILGRISYYGCRKKLRMTRVKFRGVYMNIAELTCHFCSKEHASSMYTFLRLSLPIGDVIDKENYPFTPIMLCKKEKNYEVEKVLKYWEDNHYKIWKFSKSFSLL